MSDIQQSLVEVDDSVLLVIDVQDSFLNKYDQAKTDALVGNVVWLLQVAQHLGVPIVAMGEDLERLGSLNEAILEALPEGAKIHNKNFFGVAGNPDILAAVKATGRNTAICVGVETDVCVAQSALGLNGLGYKVVALKDAVASTEAGEEIGLGRMRDAGVAISSTKALYYEWLRSVTNAVNLSAERPDLDALRPTSLVL